MSGPLDRRSLLESLVALTGNIEVTLASLRASAPSGPGASVQIDRANIRLAVEAFLNGEVSAHLLERWAEAIHGADDVVLDPADEAFLSDVLFELSTPELFGSMEEIVAGIRERDRGPSER